MEDNSNGLVVENNNAFLMAMGEGSRIEIHAADAMKMSYTQLAVRADRNSNEITVEDVTGWEVGDHIAISGTTRFRQQHEEFTITAIDGQTITLDGSLDYNHIAETRNYDNGLNGEDRNEWEVDMRAHVALLSRNVTIQGDADSAADGFGAHTMVMHGAEQHIDGAEFARVGQMDILGRYPIHWHLNGDSEGQFVTNSSIHHSYQKGATIHGASNLLVENNVIFDHIGHGLFLEDGAETGNQILGNLVFGTKASETGQPIPSDQDDPTSFWIENPENTLIGNIAAGSEGNGYWIFRHDEVHGLSADLFPGQMGDFSELIFRENTSYGARFFGAAVGGRVNPNTLEAQRGATEQVTPDAEFAIIDGYTGWNIGFQGIWTGALNVVIEDSAIINTNGAYRPLMNAHIVDSLAAEANVGLRFYFSGGNSADGVHLVDNNFDIQAFTHSRFSTPVGLRDLTSDDPINLEHAFDGPGLGNPAAEDETNSSHVFLDIDGSVTGIPGATFTPGTATTNAFRSSPDAAFDPDLGAWVTKATIASTYLYATGDGRNADLILVRDDGLSEDGLKLAGPELFATDKRPHYKAPAATGLERDVAYLLDYDNVPRDLTVDLRYARAGESVIYEIANVANFGDIRGATEMSSLNALVGAQDSAYFHNGSSLFLKLVARFDGPPPDMAVADLAAAYRTSDVIDIKGVVDGGASARHGDRSVSQQLINAIQNGPANDPTPALFTRPANLEPTDTGFVLDRYDSTSSTEQVTADMARWSEASTWSDGRPGANDIVVIGPGQTVVLDQSATVKGIIVNGGGLIVEDGPSGAADQIMLISDYVLVINGGLFQAGTEDDPLDREFTLELTGDDPNFDLEVSKILAGEVPGVVNAIAGAPATPPTDPTDAPTELGSVSGRVVDGSGAAISSVSIVLVDANGDTIAADVSRFDGTYEFELLVPGQYRVRVSETGDETKLIDVTAGQDLALDVVAAQSAPEQDPPQQTAPGEDADDGAQDASEADDAADETPAGEQPQEQGGEVAPIGPMAPLSLGGGDDGFDGTHGSDVVHGDGGDDLLLGRQAADTLSGGDGQDILRGGLGDDHITGDAGNDIVTGDRGVDYVHGGAGDDVVRGGADDDEVYGGDGDDVVVSGDRGHDLIRGGDGDDVVRGGEGDDEVHGDAGDDRLLGDIGDDALFGGEGDDVLLGAFGDDYLLGGAGDDILNGGAGADVYALEAGSGRDVLVGFETGVDKVDVSAYDGLDIDAMLSSAKKAAAGGVSLDFANGDRAIIRDMKLAELSADDFIV